MYKLYRTLNYVSDLAEAAFPLKMLKKLHSQIKYIYNNLNKQKKKWYNCTCKVLSKSQDDELANNNCEMKRFVDLMHIQYYTQ